MLVVKTPVDKVKMGIEEEVLERMIEERCENENAKKQMKRFFFATAIESIEGNIWERMPFVSYFYEKRILEPIEDEGDVIVACVKEQDNRIYLIGETVEVLKEAETWLAKFLEKENLAYSHYIMPRNFFLEES